VLPSRPTIIERAFEIARKGEVQDVTQIASQLSREGYANAVAQLTGRAIRRQLRELTVTARKAPEAQ
jgi:hypothetical protein